MKLRSYFRDCQAWKDEGLTLTTPSNEACKLYDATITQYVGWYDDERYGGLEKTIDQLQCSDPNFVLGKALSVGLQLLGTGTSIQLSTALASELDSVIKMSRLQKGFLTSREDKHIQAVKHFAQGHINKATDLWERILVEFPTDILAAKMAHDSYFYFGKQSKMRDSIARILPHWKSDMPLYSYLFGMYSFGLVETNFYGKAEENAKMGLSLNRNDGWATHAMAHVLEMRGRQDEGISFMSKTVQDWQPCGMLAGHNFWHWAVYHIENGEYEAALDIFDDRICKFAEESQGALLDIVDAASLLYRLKFEGIHPGIERWNRLLQWTVPHANDHILLFNDAHLLMSFLESEDQSCTNSFLTSAMDFAKNGDGDNADSMRSFGIDLLQGMVAYHEKQFDRAFSLLYPIRYKFVEAGGSDAQRDVFNQLLIHVALKSSDHSIFARSLLNERKAMKPNAPLTVRLMAKALSIHHEEGNPIKLI